jgi:signal transduction histidine kinase
MENLIGEALVMAREREAATDLEAVDLEAVAPDAYGTLDTADASLDVDASPVRADPDRLTRLLENLLRNAVDHGDGDVTITIGDLADGFYVADDGPGIPEADREEFFECGVTTTESDTGFGFAIVTEIATAHGRDVTATESEAGGARIEITGVERP